MPQTVDAKIISRLITDEQLQLLYTRAIDFLERVDINTADTSPQYLMFFRLQPVFLRLTPIQKQTLEKTYADANLRLGIELKTMAE